MNMKKKLWLLLSLVFCIVAMTGCSGKEDNLSKVSNESLDQMKLILDDQITRWLNTDWSVCIVDDTEAKKAQFADQNAKFEMWGEYQKDLGSVVEESEIEITEGEAKEGSLEDFSVVLTKKITYSNRKLQYTCYFTQYGDMLDNIEVEELVSVGKIMKKALMNTLMGMGTVFLVLVLISCIISLFGIINKAQNKPKQPETVNAPPAAPVVEETIEEDVTDDLELVAVITAAIMASMGDEAPADGLVVRSIKKRSVRNWKNA